MSRRRRTKCPPRCSGPSRSRFSSASSDVRRELASVSAGETERIAAALAERLVVGDVVGVAGELGAGKTTFVRGACRALGVTSPVTSPTFTIGHRYSGDGDVDVSHLDLYRFAGVSEAEWGDLEPYFDDAIVFVEWPEAGAGALPPTRLTVTLEHAGGDTRRIAFASAETALVQGIS
jgi:tRNA threonylcarbamoyladenosine biosynthesis protein TsaE